jgi:hypothetical protein
MVLSRWHGHSIIAHVEAPSLSPNVDTRCCVTLIVVWFELNHLASVRCNLLQMHYIACLCVEACSIDS